MKNMLVNEINHLSIYVNNALREYRNDRELSEALIALIEVDRKMQLDALNQAALRLIVSKGERKLQQSVFFYIAWHYLPKNVYEKDFEELSKNIAKANTQISQFRIRMYLCETLGISLDSSEDGYFFSRFDSIARAIGNYINYPFDFDISSFVYLILNYYQALLEYKKIPDSTFSKQCEENIRICRGIIQAIHSKWLQGKEAVENSRQLNAFWNSMVPAKLQINADKNLVLPSDRVADTDRWVLLSMYKYNPQEAQKYLESFFDKIIQKQYVDLKKTALNVRLLTNALTILDQRSLIEDAVSIHLVQDGKTPSFGLEHFFEHYQEIGLNQCSSQELMILQNYNDEVLRKKLAFCLKNVDMAVVANQMTKPHTGYEISDMDIPFREGGDIKYLCMPVKSGKEITGTSVTEKIAYQIYKPFSHFGADCIVVFVTAKPIGAALDGYIKRMTIKARKWRVYVLQEHQLGYLLKLNGQLN